MIYTGLKYDFFYYKMLENDTFWSLYIDNQKIVYNNTYEYCSDILQKILKDIYINDNSKNFFEEQIDENEFVLYSYPKNFPTTYARQEIHAIIQNE